MINLCKTNQQFENVIQMTNTQYFKRITEKEILPHINTAPSKHSYMIEKDDTNATSIPHTWFTYEQRITGV